MKLNLRRLRRRIAQSFALALARWAVRGGPQRIRRTGRGIGRLHYVLAWPAWIRLRRDIARACGISRTDAAGVLRTAAQVNDGAIFEVLTLGHDDLDPAALIEPVQVEGLERLRPILEAGCGGMLLGMHMGNGILLAARLASLGFPVHIVYRDPRRLQPGLLGHCLSRTGAGAIEIDRDNPTRSFRRMLAALQRGELIYVLMDQGSKREGVELPFLGKTMIMPTGLVRLAERTHAPIVPVRVLADRPDWRFEISEPLDPEPTTDRMLRAIVASMEHQILARPDLWAWHQRRWKRYHFAD